MSEALELEFQEEQEEAWVKPSFTVDSDAKAEWCLSQIRERNEEIDKWKLYYEEELEKTKKRCQEQIDFFSGLLESYFLKKQEAGLVKKAEKSCSYSLPTGKLVMKQQDPTYDKDNEKLIPWLETNDPELVKKDVKWQELKSKLSVYEGQMITEDGEVVPGIKVTERPDVFKVEVKKNGKRK